MGADKKGIGTITKLVRHYSEKLPEETLDVLKGIAEDYAKVKNYTYGRYGGIGSMDRLTPVYTILNETRSTGMRADLNLPVVYYELAVADAVRDIKSHWSLIKSRLNGIITANENLTDEDRLYLRTVLKINSTYADILNGRPYKRPDKTLEIQVDEKRLNNYLRRITRKNMVRLEISSKDYFRVTPAGYSVKDGQFKLAGREARKRINIPLKDKTVFARQVLVKLCGDHVEIDVPVAKEPEVHPDYVNVIYGHIGGTNMITLSNGAVYGKDLDKLTNPETERLNQKNKARSKARNALKEAEAEDNDQKARQIQENNLGYDKYRRMKDRSYGSVTSFINKELNRLLREEKPCRIVITKRVMRTGRHYGGKGYGISNRRAARSFSSYIRKRLACKCSDHSIQLVEINSKGTGTTCSECGGKGRFVPNKGFVCSACGKVIDIGFNSARNIEKKYKKDQEQM